MPLGEGRARVELKTGEDGVAPGQACVFYDAQTGKRVLGGGWIRRSVNRYGNAVRGRPLESEPESEHAAGA